MNMVVFFRWGLWVGNLRAYGNAPTPIREVCKLITCEFVDSAWAAALGCLMI